MVRVFSPQEQDFMSWRTSVGRLGIQWWSRPRPALSPGQVIQHFHKLLEFYFFLLLQEAMYNMLQRRFDLGFIMVMEERAIALRFRFPAPDQEDRNCQAAFRPQREYENQRRAGEDIQARHVRRDRELRRREDIYREAEAHRYELARREDRLEMDGRGEGDVHRREGGHNSRRNRRRAAGGRGRGS
jgi:hypothetical protein